MKKILLFLFVLFSTAAKSQDFVTFEGTLGKSPICLFFEDYSDAKSDDMGEVRYFYKSKLQDIVLRGAHHENTFSFRFEHGLDGKTVSEQFLLTQLADGTLKGFWNNNDGKKLPVVLTKTDPETFLKTSKSIMPELAKNELFNFIRANLMAFQKDSISVFNGKKFDWFSEKHCKMPFFRLGDGFSEKEKSVVNPILETIHLEEAMNQLTCASEFDYSNGEGIEFSTSIGYLDQNLLGFEIRSSWFCGGAHPDFGGEGYVIDLHNGKRYDIDDLLAFDTSVTTEKKSNFELYSDYRENFFAPKLYRLVDHDQHFKKPVENSPDGDDCDFTEMDLWQFPSWSLTQKGIEFTPIFARVSRACETPFLVSFDDLKIFRNPEFPYSF